MKPFKLEKTEPHMHSALEHPLAELLFHFEHLLSHTQASALPLIRMYHVGRPRPISSLSYDASLVVYYELGGLTTWGLFEPGMCSLFSYFQTYPIYYSVEFNVKVLPNCLFFLFLVQKTKATHIVGLHHLFLSDLLGAVGQPFISKTMSGLVCQSTQP